MKFDSVDYWKAIVLYGLNQATYKIALGKTLLEFASNNQNTIEWHELSKVYLDKYIDRLGLNPLPQQSNPSRLTVMERIVTALQHKKITYNQAILEVSQNAFNDVVPRFQTIGTKKELVDNLFNHFDHGKKIDLHDDIFKINESFNAELLEELDARWGLLEGAFSMVQSDYDLINDIRDIYIQDSYSRTTLTTNIPFLQGYQGNTCFYCGEPIGNLGIHVDHVLPRQVINHDEIWNLVLSHDICNLHKNDSLVGIHYLEKLMARNENIMGSNHPWKKKIADKLGSTPNKRNSTTMYHYNNAKTILRNKFWENSPSYNRETDLFFKRLITKLNNK